MLETDLLGGKNAVLLRCIIVGYVITIIRVYYGGSVLCVSNMAMYRLVRPLQW